MSARIKDVIRTLEDFAPLPLQEDYDNAGLQVGLTEAEVSGVLLCLDVTEKIVDEAIEKGCNMIVAHHPLIFRKLSHVSNENLVERCVIKAIKHDITIVAMHTNLDSVCGGVNYMIARKLGIKKENILLLAKREMCGVEAGEGIIGELNKPISASDYIHLLKKTFHAERIMTNELINRPIRKIAICGGSGSFILRDAVKNGADALLTGEMHYHDFFGYEQKVLISVIGHYESEQYTKELLQEIITDKHHDVRTILTDYITNPIRYW